MGKLMKQGSLKAGDVLEIYLPTQASSVWLNKDVVLIDRYSTGCNLLCSQTVAEKSSPASNNSTFDATYGNQPLQKSTHHNDFKFQIE